MCFSSSKPTLVVVAILCILMNGFNLTSRIFGFRDNLRESNIAAYVPDVTDISKWVDGRKNSDTIAMGLAGVSLIFDVVLLAGATLESRVMIQGSGIWGSLDCIADAVIGFLSANYTIPEFKKEEKTVRTSYEARRAKKVNSKRRVAHTLLQEDKGKKGKEKSRTEEKTIGLREPEPSVVKQILHFAWVILRLVIKTQLLWSVFSFLSILDKKAPSKGGGGGGGGEKAGTTMSVIE